MLTTELIKNRSRISLGGQPQRVVAATSTKSSSPAAQSVDEPSAANLTQKPVWDSRPIIHVEKSKTNLTPTKSQVISSSTPRFVQGVQNQLRGLHLSNKQQEFKEPQKDFKKMYFAEVERARKLQKEVENLKKQLDDYGNNIL